MKNTTTYNMSAIIKQNILYYDKIALEYDHIPQQDKSNEMIQQEVARKFLEMVQSSLVLGVLAGERESIFCG